MAEEQKKTFDFGSFARDEGLEVVDVDDNGNPIVFTPEGERKTFDVKVFLADEGMPADQLDIQINDETTPVQRSPLGPIQSGLLGWARTPEKQKEYLEKEFGSENVKEVEDSEGKKSFSIKQGNTWYAADPGFSWEKQSLGQIATEGAREVNQYIGRFGLQTAGATVGALKGAAVGSVAGPIGTVVGAITGAGLGAMGAEGVEQAVKREPLEPDEIMKRYGAALMFGVEQELGGQLVGAAGKGIFKAFGKAIEKFRNGGQQAEHAAQKLFQVISGETNPAIARARVKEPMQTAKYDVLARNDAVNATDKLYQLQQEAVENITNEAQKALRDVGGRYKVIERVAENKGTGKFNATEGAVRYLDELKADGVIDDAFKLRKTTLQSIAQDFTGEDATALNKAINTARALQTKGKQVSYKELITAKRNLDNILISASGMKSNISDPARRYVSKLYAEVDNAINSGLHAIDPQLALQKAEIDGVYGPGKELLKELLKAGDKPAKLDTLLKRIIKQDGTYNSEIVSSLSKILNVDNPVDNILRMESARRSVPLFGGRVSLKGIPTASPRGATVVTNTVSGVGKKLLPYLEKFDGLLKTMSRSDLARAVKDPNIIDNINRTIIGAAVSEEETKENLLKKSGVK